MINTLKAYIINVLLVLIACDNRLDFNSAECKIYLGKSGFHGDAAFIGAKSDVQINLRYSDTEFNDPKYWGIVQEDGKTPETTCLDLKLFKFPSDDFWNGIQVTDMLITPSNDSKTLERCYSFTIKESDFSTRLIQTSNSSYYIYRGFYGIEFHTYETNNSQFKFYFQFHVTVDRKTGTSVDISFEPYKRHYYYDDPIIFELNSSKINWCSDFTCTTIGNASDLHFNDQIILQQVITNYYLQGYYLKGTEVWYTGNGLNKQATIKQIDNTDAGKVKFLLNAEIVWGNYVTIKVNSFLQGSNTFQAITGSIDEIPCIKAEDSDFCPTCEQECDVNGFAGERCSTCKAFIQQFLHGLLLVMLVLLI